MFESGCKGTMIPSNRLFYLVQLFCLFRPNHDKTAHSILIRPSGAYAALRTTPASTLVAEGRNAVTVKRPST